MKTVDEYRVDQIKFRWFGHLKSKDEQRRIRKVLMAEASGRRERVDRG